MMKMLRQFGILGVWFIGLYMCPSLSVAQEQTSGQEVRIDLELIEEYVEAVKDPARQKEALKLRDELSQDRATLKFMREEMPREFVIYNTNGLILKLEELRAKYRRMATSIPTDTGTPVVGSYDQNLNQNRRTNQERVRSLPNTTSTVRDRLDARIRNSNSRIEETNRERVIDFSNRDRQSNQTRIRNRVRSLK